MSAVERFWVVFDGPPGSKPGRFVEVENGSHEGCGPALTGAEWSQEASGGFWRLGPFANANALQELEQREAHVIAVLRQAERCGGGYGFARQLLRYLGADQEGQG